MRSFSLPNALWLILLTSSTTFLMSFGARLRAVNVPSTKQPRSCLLLAAMLCSAVSSATLSWGAGVLIIVDQRASSGKLYVPSVKVASSKNAAKISGSSGSSPCAIKSLRSLAVPSSNFSPIKRRKTRASIISRFSKKEPAFRAARKISRHLKRMLSRLIVSSAFFFAIVSSNQR